MNEIYKKLSKIQNQLKAPKSQYNDFGKYKYRSCEDIVEAVKPLLTENGLTMTISDELVQIGERYYIKAKVAIYGCEASHEVYGYAREAEKKKGMDVSQITGAASSYARKYALNGMFAIDDNKDSDATNKGENGGKKPTSKKPPKLSNREKEVSNAIRGNKQYKKYYISCLKNARPQGHKGKFGADDLSEKDFRNILNKIKEMRKEAKNAQ